MTNIAPRPEDSFPMDVLVGTDEVVVAPPGGTTGQVPTRKNKRCIYVIVVSDTSGGANWIEIRVYASDGTTLERTWRIPLVMNDTLPLINPMDSPILSVRAGKILKAIASAASVPLHMQAYDV